MSIKINTATFSGIQGNMISVEVDIGRGLPTFNIVGMGDTAVKESKERVRAAIINSGFQFPIARVTINLAPADIKKEGTLFDLPIAIGILAATNQISDEILEEYIFMGELSLNGDLRRIRGALPTVISGIKNNIYKFIIPFKNRWECGMLKDVDIFPLTNLKEVVHYLTFKDLQPYKCELSNSSDAKYLDFEDVISQESTKRAIQIAAAGNHNIILYGPPGTGKTMLAERVPSVLPNLNYKEALECTQIYSVSNMLDENYGIFSNRPFRNPHHTSTKISLIGGGINLMPGEVSLAHNGVLFLDEILEFNKNVLDSLRQPLENRTVKISKASGTVEYPCNFMMIGALNPCPCGNYGSIRECICSDYERKRYISRLSSALLDRIDIFSQVAEIEYKDLKNTKKGYSSKQIKQKVIKARKLQENRFKNYNINTNAQMNGSMLKKFCVLDLNCENLLEKMYNKFKFSTRVYTRILKVSRTIADIEERENIKESDLIEAMQYRKFIDKII
ncbi:YifB family Mg chelatase-like AAA ATPase [Clostridium rectalis]|uniref:YifB family Mg chelatase-like AAA ATPase n=1 Tax=Clostridium rectalis TaxID=2040295 RepID=UPI000F635C5E|nr:YifB family Mg chelatase-like AAA ATPase [Clostridium rectalis]